MADFPDYQPASPRCAKGAQPGVEEFMEWAVRDFGRGAFNLGIYNCRSVRGSDNRSLHGDGRAGDVGFKLVGGRANPNGWALLNLLLPHVRTLGIQMIIWDRRIWSQRTPNGAPYQGVASHTDHLHIEFTWEASRSLTRERVAGVLGAGGRPPVKPPVYRPPTSQPKDWFDMATKAELEAIVRKVVAEEQAETRSWVRDELDRTRSWIRDELTRVVAAFTREIRARR